MNAPQSGPRFLGWSGPLLPLAAARLVREHAEGGVADMRGSIVVVPGGRAGRRLKEVLVDAAQDAGVRLVPPRVVGFGGLAELLYESRAPLADPAVTRLAWIRALEATPTDDLEPVLGRTLDDSGARVLANFADDLARLHREVGAGGYRFEDVARTCRQHAPDLGADDSPRWRALASIQARYQSVLEGAGMADRDLERCAAVDESRIRTDATIWLIGLPELPRITGLMLEEVGDRVRPLVHAPEALPGTTGDHVRPDGTIDVAVWADRHVDLPDDRIRFVDGPGDQADEVLRQLAKRAAGRSTEEISIGAPDADLLPWLGEALDGVGLAARDARGRAVSDTAPFRALQAIGTFTAGRRYEAFAALIRHPDVEAWIDRAGQGDGPADLDLDAQWLDAVDRWYASALPARMPTAGGAVGGGRDSERATVSEVLRRLDRGLLGEITAGPPDRSRSAWTPVLVALLDRLYAGRELDGGRRRDRSLARALTRVAAGCHALASIPAALDGPVSASAALEEALKLVSSGRIAAEPESDAIEVLGWLELHPDDAPVKIVTGMNAGFVPESVRSDPFLPDPLRTVLQLPDDRTRLARDAYRLHAMARSTPELVLIAGRRTGRNDPLRPSRLFFAADESTVVERVRRFFAPERGEADAPSGRADGEGSATAGRADGAGPEASGPHPPAATFAAPPVIRIEPREELVKLRVTDFSKLLADPYRFAVQRLVAGDSVRDDARELDPLQFGTLTHEVLERLGREDAIHSDDVEHLVERLDSHLNAAYQRRYRSDAQVPHVSVKVQREQIRARLHAFAGWHAGRIAEGWRVVGIEVETAGEGVPLDVDGRPMLISGKIDRVEHHAATGRFAVFDYKTSSYPRRPDQVHQTRGEWVDLQLPLYRWMLPKLEDERGRAQFPQAAGADITVGYINICQSLARVGAEEATWGEADFDDAIETARGVVRALRDEGFPWDPSRRPAYADDDLERMLGKGVLSPPATGGDA